MDNEAVRPFLLNLPYNLHRRVKRIAKRKNSTITKEIIRAVENYLGDNVISEPTPIPDTEDVSK